MATKTDAMLTFDQLSDGQRAVAWAVIRCLATALWVAVTATTLVWILVAGRTGTIGTWSLPPLIGVFCLALALEVKSRDLEKVETSKERRCENFS